MPSFDGLLCLGAGTVTAVLYKLEGAILTLPGRELLVLHRECGCSPPGPARREEGAGLAELEVKLHFVGFRLRLEGVIGSRAFFSS